MICKLCHLDRELSNSHIIPEFFYKPGYDEDGQMVALESGELEATYLQHNKFIYEKLLCSECEDFLNQNYERYFYNIWYMNKALPPNVSSNILHLPKLDYIKFKLFHLSILWRASISSLDSYKSVSLGTEKEEYIRNLLLNQNPGLSNGYQIFGVVVLSPGTNEVVDGFISYPKLNVYMGFPIYMFIFGRTAWHYVVSDHQIEGLRSISLCNDGTMQMKVYDLSRITPISRFFVEEVSKMKLPSKRKSK
jgi:hypothetical protein